GAEDAVLAQVGARFDPAVVADEDRALDGGVGVDLGALPHPHALAEAEPGDVDVDLAVEHVVVSADVRVERAHILPIALGDGAEEGLALLEQLWEHLGREVDRLAAGDEVEDLRLEHVDAGVDRVAEDLAPAGLLEEAL